MNKIEQYTRFFELQRHEQEEEYEQYANTSLDTLFSSGFSFYGEIKGVSANGNLVLHFSSPFCPRLKVPMVFCVLKSACNQILGNDLSSWNIDSISFRSKMDCHSSFSDILPIYYLKDDKHTLGCERVDLQMIQAIEHALAQHRHLQFVMLETLPPTELLMNLVKYVTSHPLDKDLFLTAKRTYDEWHPIELESKDSVDRKLMSVLNDEKIAVLQGPPGTGKSYTIASIIEKWVSEGKKICVTTQSNSSLISLIGQDPLQEYLKKKQVYKTNLSSEESKKYPSIRVANKDLTISAGDLLCSTYYTLSRIINVVSEPIYDLIIIEEASQAYSAAIASFRKLGKMCLIVGDPMQLPPIVKILRPSDYDGIDVESQVNGMMNVICSLDLPSFRMTTSFRLTANSASQTSIFYNEHLTSIASQNILSCEDPVLKRYFPKEGGTILYETAGSSCAELSEEALSLMEKIETFFQQKYPKKKLAILSPYVKTTKRLQQYFCGDDQTLDITVDTINRIQGLTVDYTIYYVPTRNFNFAFSENLFNVATSRSSTTTLLITDFPLSLLPIKSEKVRKFLQQCKIINSDGPTESVQQNKQSNIGGLKVVGFIDPSTFERKKKELSVDKENIYIIDTNVFVNCPDIISKIDKMYKVVLSAKVIDELDYLKIKLKPEEVRNAENALRNINRSLENPNVSMELSDMSLLPDDFDKRSPDNKILTVALKFKDENPILLTSDNGLQVKAKGLKISTVSLKDFLKR